MFTNFPARLVASPTVPQRTARKLGEWLALHLHPNNEPTTRPKDRLHGLYICTRTHTHNARYLGFD